MIYPLFSILAGLGGIIAYHFKKRKIDNRDSNEFNKMNVTIVMMIPFLIGVVEGDSALKYEEFIITETVEISSPISDVWYNLTNINEIPENEGKMSLSTFIGFPRHLSTTIDSMKVGSNRKSIYENGLYFDEKIIEMKENKILILEINTDPSLIPPNVMDEHIIIGGRHLDIMQDNYELDSIAFNKTKLSLSSHFFINTSFNWYASIWAKYLMKDILSSELNLIKNRCEN